MFFKKLSLLLLTGCITSVAVAQSYAPEQKILIERIKWFYSIKNFAADKIWPGFGNKNKEISLAYFTNDASYVVDPGGLLSKRASTQLFYQDPAIRILKTAQRIDDRPFHMETAMETKDRTALYYNYPIMMCSDYEGTLKTIPQLGSLQEWASMVLHEYFHGFQMKHKPTAQYGDESITLRGREIQAFYTSYPWFKASVDEENDLLITCLEATRPSIYLPLLKRFQALRKARVKRLEDSLKINFALQEAFYEKLEGTAKYVEIKLLESFKKIAPDRKLLMIDTAYKANAYKDFNADKEKWMYDTRSINYFYATGFNMIRVLDKLKIAYKKDLFNQSNTSPYSLLSAYLDKLP